MINNYRRVRVVGKGTFGQAVLVQSKVDNNYYIIKQINISGIPEKERKEALNEVKVLASLSHPNIIKYIDSFTDGGKLNIVMEYASQGDLYDKIKKQGGKPFSEEKIMDWFIQICLAVKYIHDKRILHRDLKTQNIFLTQDGSVKLGDFGISKVLQSTMECARTLVGTPYYLSPELCQEKPYNNKSDIWSLGCILYEMVTQKHAFEANNMKALVGKILRGTYPPISTTFSSGLRDLVSKMLQKDPKDRPSINSVLKLPFIQSRMEFLVTKIEPETTGEKEKQSSPTKENLTPPPLKKNVSSHSVSKSPPVEKDDKFFLGIKDLDQKTREERAKEYIRQVSSRQDGNYKPVRSPLNDIQSPSPNNGFIQPKYIEDKIRKQAQEQREKEKERLVRIQKEKERQYIEEERRLKELAEKKREAENRRKKLEEQRLERERRKVFEEARLAALKNKLRVQEEDVVSNRNSPRIVNNLGVAKVKKQNEVVTKEDLKKKEEMKLAEFRKQQYWEMRKQSELNRKKIESQIYGTDLEVEKSTDNSEIKPSVAERQLMVEDKRRQDRLNRLKNDYEKKGMDENINNGYRSNFNFDNINNPSNIKEINWNNSILNTLKKVIGDIKVADNDDDDIFTGDGVVQKVSPMGIPQKFKMAGKTLKLGGIKDADTLHFRIEALRKYLEDELGDEVLLGVYKLLRSEDIDEALVDNTVSKVLGKEKNGYISLIHQLLFCEDVLNDQQLG
ncbi:hypothetical protein ABK040_011629 [Willaertia magna]